MSELTGPESFDIMFFEMLYIRKQKELKLGLPETIADNATVKKIKKLEICFEYLWVFVDFHRILEIVHLGFGFIKAKTPQNFKW